MRVQVLLFDKASPLRYLNYGHQVQPSIYTRNFNLACPFRVIINNNAASRRYIAVCSRTQSMIALQISRRMSRKNGDAIIDAIVV